jgi:hypothetical protein
VHLNRDHGAAPSWRLLKSDLPRMVHVRPFDRAPCDQLVRLVLGNFGIPFDGRAEGPGYHPMGLAFAGGFHGYHMLHE